MDSLFQTFDQHFSHWLICNDLDIFYSSQQMAVQNYVEHV